MYSYIGDTTLAGGGILNKANLLRSETVLSGIKLEVRLQSKLRSELKADPLFDSRWLRAEIAGVREQYRQLMTQRERALAFREEVS